MPRRWILLALVFPLLLTAQFKPYQLRWWAIQPVVKKAPPMVSLNPIDGFLLAKLQASGLGYRAPADKWTLIRRVTVDLTGLPPTPEEVAAFQADNSQNAYENVVDRLLASPRYGERAARFWLDIARYADSEGFKADETRPNIWRYRDYVIDAFNSDKPYDRFVKEQLAGDELYPGDTAALIATGFNRHFPDESNAANVANRRQELLNDVTDTVASAFLGVTVACARCHDHKFDPILHKDYYRLQSFFANTRIKDDAVVDAPSVVAAFETKQAMWEEKTRTIREEMGKLLTPQRESEHKDRMSRFPEDIQAIFKMPATARTPYQWQMYQKALPQVEFTDASVAGKLKGEAKARYAELAKTLGGYDAEFKPAPLQVAQTMVDESAAAPPTFILRGGAYDAPMEQVAPGFLSILDPKPAVLPKVGEQTTGRRAALANWIASPMNPLTARVMVNRMWQSHFGRGIVGSTGDFGVMGERPTHPELLDYLSATFVEQGWSMKLLHKQMVMTAAYRQGGEFDSAAAGKDPDNKLLWRYRRRRLEGEAVRDAGLLVSGLINPKMGGPGVFPQKAEAAKNDPLNVGEAIAEGNRRSVYVFVRRNARYPLFESFDMPDTHETCSRRQQTVNVTQSLALLNDGVVLGWADAMAARVLNDAGMSRGEQIGRAFRLAYGRAPRAEEVASSEKFFARQVGLSGNSLNASRAALVDLCHVLINSNEFLYVD